jgi:threonine/homoserine/homoserine lactone efflux protein
MDALPTLLTVVSMHVAAVMSPGPNFLLSVKHGASHSRPIALLTTAGIATGTFLHVTLGLLGLSVVVRRSVGLYLALKYAAAGYLFYLGVTALRSAMRREIPSFTGDATRRQNGQLSARRAYVMGLLTNATNPKAFVYFLALFTSVVLPDTPLPVRATLVFVLPLVSWLWYSCVAMSFSTAVTHRLYARIGPWVDVGFGASMIAVGLMIVTEAG